MTELQYLKSRLRGHVVRATLPARGVGRRGICLHEAGHAVMGMSLGCPIVAIRVGYGSDASRSFCLAEGTCLVGHSAKIAAYAVSGVVAQRVSWIGNADARMFIDACDAIGLDPSAEYVSIKEAASEHLSKLRPAIVAIADALDRCHTIERNRIENVAILACPQLRESLPTGKIGPTESAWNLARFVIRHKMKRLPLTWREEQLVRIASGL
jgi:hypothetical protein